MADTDDNARSIAASAYRIARLHTGGRDQARAELLDMLADAGSALLARAFAEAVLNHATDAESAARAGVERVDPRLWADVLDAFRASVAKGFRWDRGAVARALHAVNRAAGGGDAVR